MSPITVFSFQIHNHSLRTRICAAQVIITHDGKIFMSLVFSVFQSISMQVLEYLTSITGHQLNSLPSTINLPAIQFTNGLYKYIILNKTKILQRFLHDF